MRKFLIRGPDRTARGWPYYFCAQRGWGQNEVLITVHDGAERIYVEKTAADGTKSRQLDPLQLTEIEFAELRADPQINIRGVDDAGTKDLQVNVVELVAKEKATSDENVRLKETVAFLQKKLTEFESLLAEATKPVVPVPSVIRQRKAS